MLVFLHGYSYNVCSYRFKCSAGLITRGVYGEKQIQHEAKPNAVFAFRHAPRAKNPHEIKWLINWFIVRSIPEMTIDT